MTDLPAHLNLLADFNWEDVALVSFIISYSILLNVYKVPILQNGANLPGLTALRDKVQAFINNNFDKNEH
jgi:hypothetical protein